MNESFSEATGANDTLGKRNSVCKDKMCLKHVSLVQLCEFLLRSWRHH